MDFRAAKCISLGNDGPPHGTDISPAQLLMSPVPPSDPDSVQTCRLRRVWCPAACVCRLELQTKVPEDFTITEKVPTRAFSWLKVPTSAFTFKTLLRHHAKRALTPRSLNVKLGPRRNYHKGRAVWLA